MSKEARLLLGRTADRRASAFEFLTFRRVAFSVWTFFLTAACLLGASANVFAATYRTHNFIVYAESDDFAREAAAVAEQYRRDLAIFWFGEELPNWSNPCVLTIKSGPNLGAGGETVFTVANGEVFGWKMTAQGTETRILDSVLPHEITHAVLASYLRAQAPRWIDEGMATAVEAEEERSNYRFNLAESLHSRKGIAFNDMVAMKEYPDDVTPFYSQAFSVCEYLILIGGPRRLAEFAKEGARSNDWNAALRRYYEGRSLGDLQLEWVAWIGEWDAANRPAQLPATPKLRDFDEWRREEALASRGNAPRQIRAAEPTARAQSAEFDESPSKWKTTLGDVFDGVRSWGRGSENGKSGENLTARGREKKVEPTSANAFEDLGTPSPNARIDRSRQFGETRQVEPNRRVEQTAQNSRNGTATPNVDGRRATAWIPRSGGSASLSAPKAGGTGVLSSGAGSASRTNVF